MTDTQKNFVEHLKMYFNKKDKYNYKSVMAQAQKDNHFEKMVQSMTVERINGGSILAKNNVLWK